jgi:hypothetical protein
MKSEFALPEKSEFFITYTIFQNANKEFGSLGLSNENFDILVKKVRELKAKYPDRRFVICEIYKNGVKTVRRFVWESNPIIVRGKVLVRNGK